MKLPQLSLRELFWLVALVAMGCGWWVERRSKEAMRDRNRVVEDWKRMSEEAGFRFSYETFKDGSEQWDVQTPVLDR